MTGDYGGADATSIKTTLAARTSRPGDHTLVCLLGMLGLRVSEACAADLTDIRYESG